MGLNEELGERYRTCWPELIWRVPADAGYSNPLLIRVSPLYQRAPLRLMIVGQETFGWFGPFQPEPCEERIAFLRHGYEEFRFGRDYRSSPFWRFAHLLRKMLMPGSGHEAIAWGNLNPIDCHRHRPVLIESSLSEVGLIREEIRILRPQCVVFLTGPNYDSVLSSYLPGVKCEACCDLPERTLARLVHPELPPKSFRTYHPNYLLRSGKFQAVLEQLAKEGSS